MTNRFIKHNRLDLDQLFTTYENRQALIMPHQILTFRELKTHLLVVIHNLEKAGAAKGKQIALHQENSYLHLLMLLAGWAMDFVFIPLNFKAPLDKSLPLVHIDLLFSKEKLSEAEEISVLDPDILLKDPISARQSFSLPEPDLTQEASVIFTSGSTGTPSGVVHTVGSYVFSALGTIESLALDRNDSWLITLPLYHVGGLLIFIRTLLSGIGCIIHNDLKAIDIAITSYKPTVTSLVPTQLIRFLDSPDIVKQLQLSKAILLGGGPSPKWLITKSLELKLPIIPTYGSTEACAQSTAVNRDASNNEYYTSGKVLPYREIDLNENNEILIGGKTLFKYYIKNKSKIFPIENGKFKTTDMGRFDRNGNLVLLGRSDQVFISGGENVHPFEIESCLLQTDQIAEAIVVPAPHREFGMVPVAFIEPTRPVDKNLIKENLRKMLPPYKIPKRIYDLDPDTKTSDMKYSREELKQKAALLAGDN